ncbi:HdeD family acid-resistance protein [Oricola nitratireducens]|uniref:HdeD family acid-resistance protein n=1 Tax=Oricola nitratireducens TaxID=2775868 RepID=UPI001FEEA2CA|nr:HdeD family acid-resistance protein [Oricola nitratireducens]
MSEIITVDQAARILRAAMRDAIRRHSFWYLAQGVLMMLAGVVALLFPVFSSVAVILALGWLLIFSGILQAISLIGASNVPHFWLQLISVALSVIVGFLFLTSPGEGLVALTLLLIVFFIVGGMAKIVFALTIRPFPNWGWILGSGIVGLLLGVILFAQMPVSAAWLLGLLVGIQLVTEGAALAWMAWQIRHAVHDAA